APQMPSWMPTVETGRESYRWRQLWVYDLTTHRAAWVSPPNCNIWDAVWCGHDRLAVVTSAGPDEGLWYSAKLAVLALHTGELRELYAPRDQLGALSAAPSGRHIACVEAISSDRGVVAGALQLIDPMEGRTERADT